MITANIFGDVNELQERWGKRSQEMIERWEASPTSLNKKRLQAIGILCKRPRIADMEKRLDFKYYILTQKLEHLVIAKTSIEIDQILMNAVEDGMVKIPLNSLYWMVEEEYLVWQRQIREAPVTRHGNKRYMKVSAALSDKFGLENSFGEVVDISDISILTLEDLKVYRDLLAREHGLKNEEEEKEENVVEQMLLF
ncbi:hypothetical protein QTG56_26050 (plasmid) [Rossellomorea sp. AcN35-11]|nr:hypothetical protein [Rossellomorea aquimaris]WJV32080.1 hypothetical protein QTG56_26050 [Rossellomorea sp. AcN35-11]